MVTAEPPYEKRVLVADEMMPLDELCRSADLARTLTNLAAANVHPQISASVCLGRIVSAFAFRPILTLVSVVALPAIPLSRTVLDVPARRTGLRQDSPPAARATPPPRDDRSPNLLARRRRDTPRPRSPPYRKRRSSSNARRNLDPGRGETGIVFDRCRARPDDATGRESSPRRRPSRPPRSQGEFFAQPPRFDVARPDHDRPGMVRRSPERHAVGEPETRVCQSGLPEKKLADATAAGEHGPGVPTRPRRTLLASSAEERPLHYHTCLFLFLASRI